MENEYDQLIKDFKDGNFRSYEESIENTSKRIIQIKTDLENNVNVEFENFQKDLKNFEKELKFEQILKELEMDIYKNDPEAFNSVEQAEREFFSGVGTIASDVGNFVGNTLLNIGYIASKNMTLEAGLNMLSTIYSNGMLATGLTSVGIGALAIVGIAGFIHGGFAINKQLTKKGRYIEFIENEKKEIKYSMIIFQEKVNDASEKCKNQLEIGIKNFEKIIFSKSEGLKENKAEWKKLYNLFKKRLRFAFEIK